MQPNETTRGRHTDESREMVLRQMLGGQNIPPRLEEMKRMRSRLAWNAKYIDMLEDLIVHYQREVNFWKGRE